MCIKVSKGISVSSWNVNGLFRKVNGQKLCKLDDNIITSDIMCLSETHTISNQVLECEGYKCFMNCRKYESKKPSGGLATFIKKDIIHGIQLVDRSNSDMFWFRLDKGFFKFSKDLYLCFVYISPKHSSYTLKTNCDKIIFEKLERDISKFSTMGDIVVMGDLNAHINKDEQDFILNDSDSVLDDILPKNYISDSVQKVRNTELPQKTNEYGKNVIELCSDAQLRILNGRTIGDSRGQMTYFNYAGASIDDYCICNSNFLRNILSFSVDKFNPFLSDHCPITVKIFSQYSVDLRQDNLLKNIKKVKWNNATEALFKSNLTSFDFDKELNDITSLNMVTPSTVVNPSKIINEKINKFSSFLVNAATSKKSYHINNHNKLKLKRKRKPKKLWYDSECDIKYRHVKDLARKLSNNPWDKYLRQKVALNNKELVKLIRKKNRLFKNNLMKNILDSEERNPAEFWAKINQLKNQAKEDPSTNISPTEWVNYFTELMNIKHVNNFSNIEAFIDNNYNSEILNMDVSTEEVLKAVRELKNGKASGPDGILNEMLRISCIFNTKFYASIFNSIIKHGIYPDLWKENFIKPIFKGGCFNNPANYRGVALSSCFGKFFSKILSNRLDKFLDQNNILCNEQIGFRKNCRTSDHIFTLKCLIDKSFRMSKRLYVCFIDLHKAFDTINREALLYKLCKYNISGNFFNILKNMYDEVHYSIKTSDGCTNMFSSKIGVKQGCILSPTLFSIYLNDMTKIFDYSCDPVTIDGVKVSSLLYADDIVLISESEKGLQSCLDKLYDYCSMWNLSVNIGKSKVMIFNKSGRLINSYRFSLNNQDLEISNEYKYLGIIFKPSCSFAKANEYLCKKARKALFCIYKTLFSDRLNILINIKLFDACVKPILLYCSEIICLDSLLKENTILEDRYILYPQTKVQIRFAKHTLGVSKTASNNAVLGELGMFPCSIDALKLSIGYWHHLINSKCNSLINCCYFSNDNISFWLKEKMKLLFHKTGFNHVWQNQNTFSKNRLMFAISRNLKEKFVHSWKDKISNSSNINSGNKLRTYQQFKKEFEMEKFLTLDTDRTDLINFVRIRISNSSLMIEKGRHRKLSLDNRLCPLCKTEVEDELHFSIKCIKLEEYRIDFFKRISDIVPDFIKMSDTEKFHFIFQSNDYDVSMCCISGISGLYKYRNRLL